MSHKLTFIEKQIGKRGFVDPDEYIRSLIRADFDQFERQKFDKRLLEALDGEDHQKTGD